MKLSKNNFKKVLDKNYTFEDYPKVALALSGGPDSMSLFFLLLNWIKVAKGKLIVLIINHNLRKESLTEANKIKRYIKSYNIFSKIISVNKRKIKNKSMNEARNNRYELLTNYCLSNNLLHLFVGHHKDDNIETFLTRKVSGSDFEGLESIKFISTRNKINIIRPLLFFSKEDILTFNNKNKIPFVIDPSNTNLNYTRASIRKFLKNTSKKNVDEINYEFSAIKKNIKYYNEIVSDLLIENILEIKKTNVSIDFENFCNIHILMQDKIIKKLYNFLNHEKTFLRSSKIEDAIVKIKDPNFEFYNLKGMMIKKAQKSLFFQKKGN